MDVGGLRASVRSSLPEIDDIDDENLREKVVEVHALALSETEFTRIEDIPEPEEGAGASPLRFGTQADHYRAVTRMAVALADALEGLYGELGIDRDILIASALCHDVGKAFPSNSAHETTRAGRRILRWPDFRPSDIQCTGSTWGSRWACLRKSYIALAATRCRVRAP
jgi:hypothetical protein